HHRLDRVFDLAPLVQIFVALARRELSLIEEHHGLVAGHQLDCAERGAADGFGVRVRAACGERLRPAHDGFPFADSFARAATSSAKCVRSSTAFALSPFKYACSPSIASIARLVFTFLSASAEITSGFLRSVSRSSKTLSISSSGPLIANTPRASW